MFKTNEYLWIPIWYFVETKTGYLNTRVKFYIDKAIMLKMFIHGVCRTNIDKPIMTINSITRDWAIEGT